jgi:DNA-binding transcriptional ArsR family regulator
VAASSPDLESIAHLLAGLGHPIRLRIVLALDAGALSPRALHERLGVGLSLVAYHVRALRDEELVELVGTRPARGSVESFYGLTPSGRQARAMLQAAWPDIAGDAELA